MITYALNSSDRQHIYELSEKGSHAEAAIIDRVMRGDYHGAIDKIVSYDEDEGWSRPSTEDIAIACAKLVNEAFNRDGAMALPRRELHDFITGACDVKIPPPADPTFVAA